MSTIARRRTRAALVLGMTTLLTMLVLAAVRHARAEATAPPRVRLAYFPNVTHAAAIVGVARGTFADALGDEGALEPKTFPAGPALIEALFAGEVDVGYVGPNPAINGYVKSKGEALRVIAGASSAGAQFVVRADANIAKPADLSGKTFATPQLGGTQDVALRLYVRRHGLDTADRGGTVTIQPAQPADIFTLFREGKIQGAWMAEPWVSRLVIEGGGRVFLDERDEWPDGRFVTTVVVARTEFLTQHPDLVRRLLEAHVDSIAFLNERPDKAQRVVNAEIARITTKALPDAVVASAFENTEFTTDPLPNTLQKAADSAFELGFLGTERPQLFGIWALQPLEAVVAARKNRVAAR
ncbi:MAG: ABC transporter substrate-binding protein [bacterium]|nr:ABC transporter substrate-binding protein [bacterium]